VSVHRDHEGAGWTRALARLYAGAVVGLATAIMAVVVVIMGVQVFFRYVLNDSLIWAEEVSGYLLVLMTFLFVGAAYERGEMATLRLLVDLLPARVRIAIMLPSLGAMIGFLWVLAYYGLRFAEMGSSYNIPAASFIGSAVLGPGADLRVSMYWLYLAIPAGCLLLSGHLLVALWRLGRAARGRAELADVLPGADRAGEEAG
jgi:TRAP-type C4-dicarboxylate transport system permease small subunit